MKTRDLSDKDKERVIEYIHKGFTTKEIMVKMRNLYSHQQIAALRAHETMNSSSYGETKGVSIISERDKEVIINFVRSGLGVPEIIKKMKSRYTRQQIAAVKAHVTMGTY